MKCNRILIILLIITTGFSYAQSFPRLQVNDTFKTTTFNNFFEDKNQYILVTVDRGAMDGMYTFGIIPNVLRSVYFTFDKQIYFLKGPLSENSIAKLYICDGKKGLFAFVADVSQIYTISKDGEFIIYVNEDYKSHPDLVIKNKNNTILKKYLGDELFKNVYQKQSPGDFKMFLSVIYDETLNRFLFTYGDFFGGYIDLPSLNITLLDNKSYIDFQEKYFPNSGM